jgi:hypothetical protein
MRVLNALQGILIALMVCCCAAGPAVAQHQFGYSQSQGQSEGESRERYCQAYADKVTKDCLTKIGQNPPAAPMPHGRRTGDILGALGQVMSQAGQCGDEAKNAWAMCMNAPQWGRQ